MVVGSEEICHCLNYFPVFERRDHLLKLSGGIEVGHLGAVETTVQRASMKTQRDPCLYLVNHTMFTTKRLSHMTSCRMAQWLQASPGCSLLQRT